MTLSDDLRRRMTDAGLEIVAFHLPQYHSVPENDRWWGRGFTEWTLVRRARPLFLGHRQPRRPAPVPGYYDLSDPAVLEWQAHTARAYGIGGFCFYHFWFRSKRLLHEPVDRFLRGGLPAIDFCLAWANEPWTRGWDGSDEAVLQPQTYGGPATWRAHCRALAPALRDARAIRIGAKPLLLIYRAGHIPNARAMLDCWRDEALRIGIGEIFVAAMSNGFNDADDDALRAVDAVVDFAPFSALRNRKRGGKGQHYDYETVWEQLRKPQRRHRMQFRGAFVSWDNTPRRGKRGIVFDGATPARYRHHLAQQIRAVLRRPRRERLLFLNAWNEWGEGCTLEPDADLGTAYLEATAAAIGDAFAQEQSGEIEPERHRLLARHDGLPVIADQPENL